MKRLLFLLLVIIILAVAVALGSQNDALVSVNYLIAKTQLQLSTLMAISLGLGVVVGCLLMLSSYLTMRVKLIRLQARLKKLNKDL